MASEVKNALFARAQGLKVVELIAGLGGRDVSMDDFRRIFSRCEAAAAGEPAPPFEIMNVRE